MVKNDGMALSANQVSRLKVAQARSRNGTAELVGARVSSGRARRLGLISGMEGHPSVFEFVDQECRGICK